MKRFIVAKLGLLGMLWLFLVPAASAQCAMCRSTLENNVSDGTFLLTSDNLNTGIMYLFMSPYLLIGAVALIWYYNARKNARNIHRKSYSGS